ncbi:MAG: hypothetical protein ABIW02_04625 [Nitrosospira sp.]
MMWQQFFALLLKAKPVMPMVIWSIWKHVETSRYSSRWAAPNPDYISSDCAIAGGHIQQGMGGTKAQKQHPLTLVRIAYGL